MLGLAILSCSQGIEDSSCSTRSVLVANENVRANDHFVDFISIGGNTCREDFPLGSFKLVSNGTLLSGADQNLADAIQAEYFECYNVCVDVDVSLQYIFDVLTVGVCVNDAINIQDIRIGVGTDSGQLWFIDIPCAEGCDVLRNPASASPCKR